MLNKTAMGGGMFALLIISVIAVCIFYQLYQARSANVISFWQIEHVSQNKKIDHSYWQAVLSAYVTNEQQPNAKLAISAKRSTHFNYAAVTVEHKAVLKKYLQKMQQLDPRDYPKNEQLAYWVNLYNALTVQLVLTHYPVASIRTIASTDLGLLGEFIGPWDSVIATVAGIKLTLNQIEHGILRAIWQDPRIHYVLNCASKGCPDITRQAFASGQTNQQLDLAASRFINQDKAVRFSGDKLYLSKIYYWFEQDFGGNKTQVLSHLASHSKGELSHRLARFSGDIIYQYNWLLNQPIKKSKAILTKTHTQKVITNYAY
ncbi:DUF547 domain-containing protein [Colwellia psychrerythraea]|uniref:DUF547 domain-containing protein n=1 Tax=Colwellia psychrerythraea TaxID=28229 RepID=A0A099KSV4_COLPS|nr:DUF547 domain-containing protein [Colwellia psychrerythraea]KGJ93854.1 protein of unknown function DUF547 [Colwellia psychrerythraea]